MEEESELDISCHDTYVSNRSIIWALFWDLGNQPNLLFAVEKDLIEFSSSNKPCRELLCFVPIAEQFIFHAQNVPKKWTVKCQ